MLLGTLDESNKASAKMPFLAFIYLEMFLAVNQNFVCMSVCKKNSNNLKVGYLQKRALYFQ